mmetsp:Transcript_1481/g.1883  ORF Transcript_1481/g.1883 Transcript_1481/m.1883 type:complete len:408 (+) Transcript_1481:71-1294(+)
MITSLNQILAIIDARQKNHRRRLDEVDDVEDPLFHLILLHYVSIVCLTLVIFLAYLITPRGCRVRYCGAYPRQYARSYRTKPKKRDHHLAAGGGYRKPPHQPPNTTATDQRSSARDRSSSINNNGSATYSAAFEDVTLSTAERDHFQQQQPQRQFQYRQERPPVAPQQRRDDVKNTEEGNRQQQQQQGGVSNSSSFHSDPEHDPEITVTNPKQQQQQQAPEENTDYDEYDDDETTNPALLSDVVISATMQELRDPGVRLIAHGTKSKPKTVLLQLNQRTITWQTEKKVVPGVGKAGAAPKPSKMHDVPLEEILYVDVGKHTNALRKMENAGVPDRVCFSLLTRQGSLDLQADSVVKRDALVSCFSLVLDEVHASLDWRNVYGGPTSDLVSDMPSSIDTEIFMDESIK